MSCADGELAVAEIVSALSYALDLTEDAVPGHALRSCLLGMRIAEEIGLAQSQRSSLYYALLLKDVGCSSNAARLCQIIGADERQLKRTVKFEDWTRPTWSGTKLAWRSMAPGESKAAKIRRLLSLGLNQQNNNREMIALRCDRGAAIVRKIGLAEETAEAVRHLDEHWDGSGFPLRLEGEAIPLLARILLLAQHLDVFYAEHGAERAIDSLRERSGTWLDPELVAAARALDRAGSLWKDLDGERAREAVLDREPGGRRMADGNQTDAICEAFAEVIDVKSPFTYRHSTGVVRWAVTIGEQLGLARDRMRLIYRAALLHDLGKLRVPNSLLDKAGGLDSEQWRVVREHPRLTRRILERVSAFGELAAVAGQHHEKLDGSGYPDGLRGEELGVEARVIAVADMYGAMAEDRSYRKGLAADEIRRVMSKLVPGKLDGTSFAALLAGVEAGSREVPKRGMVATPAARAAARVAGYGNLAWEVS